MSAALLAVGPGPAAAKNPVKRERHMCAQNLQKDRSTCERQALEQCRATFETKLPGCFKEGSPCIGRCIGADKTCREQPAIDRDGCRTACGADQKIVRKRCETEVDRDACRAKARLNALKCKQACVMQYEPALQACGQTFYDCLDDCAAED